MNEQILDASRGGGVEPLVWTEKKPRVTEDYASPDFKLDVPCAVVGIEIVEPFGIGNNCEILHLHGDSEPGRVLGVLLYNVARSFPFWPTYIYVPRGCHFGASLSGCRWGAPKLRLHWRTEPLRTDAVTLALGFVEKTYGGAPWFVCVRESSHYGEIVVHVSEAAPRWVYAHPLVHGVRVCATRQLATGSGFARPKS